MNFKELGDRLGLEEDEYRELIDLFIETGGADFQKLQNALSVSDVEVVRRSAHTIKGASGNLGLHDLSAVASSIEMSAEKNQLEGLQPAVEKLKGHFESIENFARG